jgi:hypothetical protein
LAQPYYAILIHYSTENGIVKDHSLRKWSWCPISYHSSRHVVKLFAFVGTRLDVQRRSRSHRWQAAFVTRFSACKGRKANALFKSG